MKKLEEKDFIIGGKTESLEALLISEDCNGFIDSVLDQIYELDLTPEEEKELGIEVHRERYDNSWKRVKFTFAPGDTVLFSRWVSESRGQVYRTSHELTCNGQLDSDRMISILTGFGIVGSHTLFSYNESCEILTFDEGTEKKIRIIDGEDQLTQYAKLGFTKKTVFKPEYGWYSQEYLDRDSYKEEYVDGKRKYIGLDDEPLTQPELITTSFDSFDTAYTSFKNKLMRCREIIDSRLKEITDKKTK